MAAKGSQFEREFATKLSLWWSRETSDDLFWRATTSGARATTRHKKGMRTRGQSGDITATHKKGKLLMRMFSFELKRGYKGVNIQDLLDKPENGSILKLEQWIQQANESTRDSETWCLVIKRDRREPLMIMPADAFEFLCDATREELSDYSMATFSGIVREQTDLKYLARKLKSRFVELVAAPLELLFELDSKKLKKLIQRRFSTR